MQVSVAKYAKMIGKSRYTVYRMVDKEKLPIGVKSRDVAGRIVIELIEQK
jgi:hypothetical protein